METLLAWHTLVFYIPVAFGALLALGAAFGLAGGGAGAEGPDGDVGADGDSDGAGEAGADGDAGADPLSLLALGKLPLALRLMLLAFSFGGVGLVLGPLIRAVAPPALGGALSVAVAAIGALVISGTTARLLARRLPLFETETVRRADLVGCEGKLVLPASPAGGLAQVRDRRGNLHQVRCRLEPGAPSLPAGSAVLLVDHDQEANVFLAEAFERLPA
jgi:membrane protein implicated in regulation of membrane protease activity